MLVIVLNEPLLSIVAMSVAVPEDDTEVSFQKVPAGTNSKEIPGCAPRVRSWAFPKWRFTPRPKPNHRFPIVE